MTVGLEEQTQVLCGRTPPAFLAEGLIGMRLRGDGMLI